MNAESTFTVTKKVSFAGEHKARRNKPPDVASPASSAAGPVPRVSRLMALALHYERLMAEGAITTQAEIATLSHVTRARVTQVMNMLHLAPDIQEAILFWPATRVGRERLHERDIRHIVAQPDWERQRALWSNLSGRPAQH